MGETQLAAALDAYLQNPDEDVLLSIYDTYISSGSYDENMSAFGVVSEPFCMESKISVSKRSLPRR